MHAFILQFFWHVLACAMLASFPAPGNKASAMSANGVCIHLLVPPYTLLLLQHFLLNVTRCTERKAPFHSIKEEGLFLRLWLFLETVQLLIKHDHNSVKLKSTQSSVLIIIPLHVIMQSKLMFWSQMCRLHHRACPLLRTGHAPMPSTVPPLWAVVTPNPCSLIIFLQLGQMLGVLWLCMWMYFCHVRPNMPRQMNHNTHTFPLPASMIIPCRVRLKIPAGDHSKHGKLTAS